MAKSNKRSPLAKLRDPIADPRFRAICESAKISVLWELSALNEALPYISETRNMALRLVLGLLELGPSLSERFCDLVGDLLEKTHELNNDAEERDADRWTEREEGPSEWKVEERKKNQDLFVEALRTGDPNMIRGQTRFDEDFRSDLLEDIRSVRQHLQDLQAMLPKLNEALSNMQIGSTSRSACLPKDRRRTVAAQARKHLIQGLKREGPEGQRPYTDQEIALFFSSIGVEALDSEDKVSKFRSERKRKV